MSKFGLKENTIEVRGKPCKCRELTYGERASIIQRMTDNKVQTHAMFAAAGALEPTFTEEEAGVESAEVITLIGREVMKLSGLSVSDDETPEKNG